MPLFLSTWSHPGSLHGTGECLLYMCFESNFLLAHLKSHFSHANGLSSGKNCESSARTVVSIVAWPFCELMLRKPFSLSPVFVFNWFVVLAKRENFEEKENPKRSPSRISTTVLEELSNVLESTEQISCPLCDFKCKSTKVLKRHNYKKHLDQNILCTEDGCGKLLKNRWTLQGHIKSKHIGRTNRFMCDKCDYTCKWFSSFQEHTMKHTGNFIQCSQCEYRCTTNQALKKHMESKHNVAEYACDKCETKTRTKKMMRFHTRKVHEGVRFFCDVCSYQATTPYNLETHKKRMHDQIEITCTYCDFKDPERSRVLLHEKRKHIRETEAWPFFCINW